MYVYVWRAWTGRSDVRGRAVGLALCVGRERVGHSPPSMCGARGTLEDRGEARMRGCKSGREGEWEGICGRGEGCGRRLLATVYGARDARAHIARAVAADAPGPGAAPRALRRDGSRARAHIARAVAADAPGPGAAPRALRRDGSRARAHIARAVHRGEGRRGGRTRSRSSTMHTAARRIRRANDPPLGTGHVLLVGVDGLDGRELRTLGVV